MENMEKNSFYIKTLGCKVNQYEAEVIRENFLRLGYREARDLKSADVCIVNTCTVTDVSDLKSMRLIRSIIKKKSKILAVTGCLIEDRDLELNRLKGVDFIIRNKDKYKIPYLIGGCKGEANKGISRFSAHTRAFVKIQDGCNNSCSYCKVRIVRGKSVSRPLAEVISECKKLIYSGYKEIVLTGICLGDYGKDVSKDLRLDVLINALCDIKGEWRLRLSSIEPKDVTPRLINEMLLHEKFCKHLHIPFQSGDTDILKKMNRPYTREDYLNIVSMLKKAVPEIAVSTDIMVGFPGETERNFLNTLDFIKAVEPMRIHIFPFSRRKGTMAFTYSGIISKKEQKRRADIVNKLKGQFYQKYINKFLGKQLRVLIEDKRDISGALTGYTDNYIKVLIEGPDALKSQLTLCLFTLDESEGSLIIARPQ